MWWSNLVVRTQPCEDTWYYHGFYKALKTAYGPSHRVQSSLPSADGHTLFTDKASILNRGAEHFQTLFSADCKVQDAAQLSIPQNLIQFHFNWFLTLEETTKTFEQLKSGKVAEIDGILPDVWKHKGPVFHMKLHVFLVCCWEWEKELPQDLCDAIIITLYMNKGGESYCSNYRGIILMFIAGKILARALLKRSIPSIAEEHLSESQCTTDLVFVLCQLQEMQGAEQNPVYDACWPN